ncbi:MAG: TylF/MycF/NovP-related O-methyltransferase [Acidobacteriota bacterium]
MDRVRVKRGLAKLKRSLLLGPEARKFERIYKKYFDYTLVWRDHYVDNLRLAEGSAALSGDIVECGVWRGGMSAGIAEVIGAGRKYYLFDSFEGMPDAKDIDGAAARNWQADTESPEYFDNCRAEIGFATKAMKMAGVDFECIKGWFEDTIPTFEAVESISLLRLDADWYESTKVCLDHFYPKVVDGGLVLIDDYHTWSGCSRAVHDYLSETKSPSRISQSPSGVAYMIKRVND